MTEDPMVGMQFYRLTVKSFAGRDKKNKFYLLRDDGVPGKVVASLFGISRGVVYGIHHGRHWRE